MRNDQKSQRERFIDAARELGADDDEAKFKAKLAQIARQKVKEDPDQSVETESSE